MNDLPLRLSLRALLPVLLLAACPGKEGVLTEAEADTSAGDADESVGDTGLTGVTTGEPGGTSGEVGGESTSDAGTTVDDTTGPGSTTTVGSTTEGSTTTSGSTTEGSTTTSGSTTDVSTSGETTSGGEPGNAAVYRDCAPNDGPAFRAEVLITEAMCMATWPIDGQELRLFVYTDVPAQPGVFPIDFSTASAQYDDGGGVLQFATGGEVVLESWSDELITGTYDLTFEGGLHLTGAYAGPWCGGMVGCG